MLLRAVTVTIDTAADGSATDYTPGILSGKVYAIKYVPGTIATGGDLTITGNTSGMPILTKADCGTATVWFFPRIMPNEIADGSAFTDSSNDPPYVFAEKIKIVTAQGGDTKTGTITFYIEDFSFVSS